MNRVSWKVRESVINGLKRNGVRHFVGPQPMGYLEEELQEWLPGATSPKKICSTVLHDYTTVLNVSEIVKIKGNKIRREFCKSGVKNAVRKIESFFGILT